MADALNIALPTADQASAWLPLGEFVARHGDALLRYLRSRLANEDDARELAQECLLRLLRYADAHNEAALERIMFRIANNLLTDRWRRADVQSARDHLPLTAVELISEAPSQEREVAGQQRLARLKAVILALPPKCQAVFIFSRIQGMSHADIAAKCGISVKAVEKHITKALAACRAAECDDA